MGKKEEPTFEELVELLNDENWEFIRKEAEEEEGPSFEELLEQLKDEDEWMRAKTTKLIRKQGGSRAIEHLIVLLNDESRIVRSSASQELMIIGEPAVEPLIVVLQDGNRNAKMEAAIALMMIGDSRAIEPLQEALERDDTEEVKEEIRKALKELEDHSVEYLLGQLKIGFHNQRSRAAEQLIKLQDPNSVDPLITLLQDKNEDKSVRMYAAKALGGIGDSRAIEPLIDAFYDDVSGMRLQAARAVGEIGKPAIEPLITLLKKESGDIMHPIIKALAWIGSQTDEQPTVEPLLDLLRDENGDVRKYAARVLGRIAGRLGRLGDKRILEPMIAALQDEQEEVRCSAAGVLGRLGDDRAINPLIAALQNEKETEWNLVYISVALIKFGELIAVDPLIIALKYENDNLRYVAVKTLRKLGDKRAIEPFLRLVEEEKESYILGELEKSLIEFGDERAIKPIIKSFESSGYSYDLGDYVDQIKKQFGEKLISPLIEAATNTDEHEEIRRVAAVLLSDFRDPHVLETLLAIFNDKSKRLRTTLFLGISDIFNGTSEQNKNRLIDKITTMLVPPLSSNDEEIRLSTIQLLANLEHKQVISQLIQALGDNSTINRIEAIKALVKSQEDSVPLLIKALKDKDDLRRREVANTLGRIKDVSALNPLKHALRKEKNDLVRKIIEKAIKDIR
ncbi:MAG: HEAT repeat domain-containing protein [Candidatus Heimdallarchaeota archaeon]|nr:HEAT repeat domain-containing protein [Candidatus Heimdallarchaeota archaeon]